MSTQKQIKGDCYFCGKKFTGGGFSKHLSSCAERKQAIETANSKKTPKDQTLYHLVIKNKYQKDFWLHLEMNGTAKLQDLDDYLRAIWLECCGHMSEFYHAGNDWGEEIEMHLRADQVFSVNAEFTHMYDFGDTTETLIKVVAERQGKPLSKHPIKLMARNDMPEIYCMKCKKPATYWCQECSIEHDESGLLCDKHAENHPHEEYGELLEVANSPRFGQCAYSGPAEAPY